MPAPCLSLNSLKTPDGEPRLRDVELVVGPIYPESRIFYVNFAAYCLCDALWVVCVTRPLDRLMLLHHVVFARVACRVLHETLGRSRLWPVGCVPGASAGASRMEESARRTPVGL